MELSPAARMPIILLCLRHLPGILATWNVRSTGYDTGKIKGIFIEINRI